MKINDKYIKVYDNVFSEEFCAKYIELYEQTKHKESAAIKSKTLCYREDGTKICQRCNCQRIDIMQHELFDNLNPLAIKLFQGVLQQYIRDTNMTNYQFPESYGWEDFKIKKYNIGEQQFLPHVDVGDYATARRFLVFIVYMNDNFKKGETRFIKSNNIIKPKVGRVLVFPCLWTYPHEGLTPTGHGDSKYILGTYLHYL
jgi:hypothetical protein